MIELAFDACTKSASCAVLKDGKILASLCIESGLAHSIHLLPLIDTALKFSSYKIGDVERIYVSRGPGSFTGIRIALAAAKGLAHALNLPLIAVSTLKALSYRAQAFQGLICPLMDARRERVYAAVYAAFGGAVLVEEGQHELGELLDKIEALLEDRKTSSYEGVAFVGDGVLPYEAEIKARLSSKMLTLPAGHLASAEGVYFAAKAYESPELGYGELDGLYYRKPQAEREKLEREGQIE